MRFTDCYSGDTVCASARSTLMTGITRDILPFAKFRRHSSFPRGRHGGGAKEAGYETGGFGKWGLGNQGKDGAGGQGFDLFYGYATNGMPTPTTPTFSNSKKVELNGPPPCHLRRDHQPSRPTRTSRSFSIARGLAACRLSDPRGRARLANLQGQAMEEQGCQGGGPWTP